MYSGLVEDPGQYSLPNSVKLYEWGIYYPTGRAKVEEKVRKRGDFFLS